MTTSHAGAMTSIAQWKATYLPTTATEDDSDHVPDLSVLAERVAKDAVRAVRQKRGATASKKTAIKAATEPLPETVVV
ncbi:hypothetical protein [Paraburkholderia aspalathi]|uniref:hypothetical protein n=1 Tax=Paraburkholderia aspalathi TaxID=1324617 RepID=UPI003CB8169E